MASRDYQAKQINDAVELLTAKRKIVVQLPTGGGKTYEFALLTQRFVRAAIDGMIDKNQAVLIVVDRIELLNQAATTIRNLTGIEPTLITSKTKQFRVARVYIAMVESLVSRLNLIHNVQLVIIDECHVANFNKLHRTFLEEYIIGYTATPISSSKKDPLNNYYKDIVVGPQISELIDSGYLSQNITRVPKERVDATKFSVDKMTGDYNEGQMSNEYKSSKHLLNVIAQHMKYCEGKKTMVYNVGVEHSKKVAEAYVQMGYNCRHLDANDNNTPANDPRFDNLREETIYWFKTTPDAVLCNVGLFTRGFDEPTIERIIINFSTLSLPKWLQCCGRGGRIIDQEFIDKYQKDYPYSLSLKNTFEIIDLGGNAVSGLGDWSNDRDWYSIFHNPDRPGDGVSPTKTCPNCEGLVHAAVKECPLTIDDEGTICGYEFVRKPTAAEKEMEMIVITKNAITEGISVSELVRKYKNKYDLFTFYKMGEEVVYKLYNFTPTPTDTQIQKAFEQYYELCIEWFNQTQRGNNDNSYYADIRYDNFWIKRARTNFDKFINEKQLIKKVDEAEINHYPYTCDDCSTLVEAVNGEGLCLDCENKFQLAARESF